MQEMPYNEYIVGTPSKHIHVYITAGNYRPASETTFEWRFAGGPIVARDCILAGKNMLLFQTELL